MVIWKPTAFSGRCTAVARRRSNRGALMSELVVSMAILVLVVIPISLLFVQESKLCRAYYQEAIAMAIVDGEMELLTAGEWKAFAEGTHRYPVRAASATNLPQGQFILTRSDKLVRLEWRPDPPAKGPRVRREWRLP